MPFSAKTIQAFLLLIVLLAIAAYIYFRDTEGSSNSSSDEDLTTDLTAEARADNLPEIIGMNDVVERLIHVIARKQKNNPLLIGEPGVGKTAAIEGLAQRIARGQVPESFKNKRVLSLNLNILLAGTKYRGELEKRLQGLLKTLEADPRGTILFIDEIHMIQQARGSEGSLDIADILKPALSRGEIQIVGATTWREYEQYLKPDGAIDRRFQPVLVEEPSRDSAIQILIGAKPAYEEHHGVCIPHASIEKAVDTSMKFVHDRFLPDKASDIIDEAGAKDSFECGGAPPRAAEGVVEEVAIEAGSAHHGTALGLLHDAAKYASECGGDTPIVMESDVEEVAKQWHDHRTQPRTKK